MELNKVFSDQPALLKENLQLGTPTSSNGRIQKK
jgi:hypothetical protein